MSLALPVILAMSLQSVTPSWTSAVRQLGEPSVAGLSVSFRPSSSSSPWARSGTTLLARVSHLYGQQAIDEARRVFTRYSIVGTIVGIVAAVCAFLGADAYVAAFTSDPTAHAEGLAYFRITSVTFLLQLMLIVFGDSLRASGDFVTPAASMVLSITTNLVLDPLLIFGMWSILEPGHRGCRHCDRREQPRALVLALPDDEPALVFAAATAPPSSRGSSIRDCFFGSCGGCRPACPVTAFEPESIDSRTPLKTFIIQV